MTLRKGVWANRAMSVFVISLLSHLSDTPIGVADTIPDVRVSATTDLRNQVGKTLVWEDYWYNYWGDQSVRSLLQNGSHIRTLVLNSPPDTYVYVDELNTILIYTTCGKRLVSKGLWKEEMRHYQDNKLRNKPDVPLDVYFTPDLWAIVHLRKFTSDKTEAIKRIFRQERFASELTKFVRERMNTQGVAPSSVKIKIGNFTTDYSWLYFYVKGIPYVGKILVDHETGEICYWDLNFIRETPAEPNFRHLVKRIDQTGKWFEWDGSSLTEVK